MISLLHLHFLAGGKKPLFYDSMPKIESKRSRREDRRDRRDRGEGKNSPLGIMIDPREKSFQDDHLQSYRLEVGEYHGAQKGDIVGAIANEVGLDPQHMGKIRMFKDHTFIDLPKDMPPEIFEALKSVWVQGHQMNISIDKGRPRPGGKGGKFKSLGKGGKKFSKGKDFKEIQAPFPKLKNCCIWATLPLSNERHYPACPNIPSWTWWNYDVPVWLRKSFLFHGY